MSLRKQLEKIHLDPNVKYAKNLIPAIQAGITKRFGPFLEDSGMRLAAMTHPIFKMSWIPQEEMEASELFLRERVKDEQARQGQFTTQSVCHTTFIFIFINIHTLYIIHYYLLKGNQMRSPDDYIEDEDGFPAPASKRAKLDYDFFKTIRPKKSQHNKLDEVI